MLDESLENVEKDACSHGKGHVQHFDLGLAGAGRQRVILNEHGGEDTETENAGFNARIHAIELLK